MTWMMSQVVSSPFGTGRRAALEDRSVAGKTGTTQAARDAWFVGFSGDYVAGVWMGYDDNTPLTGVTGGGLPAEIWKRTMEGVHAGRPATPLPALVPIAPQVAAPAPQPATPVPSQQNEAPNLIESLLRGLFGG